MMSVSASISEEEVRLPWDCRLSVVTSVTGYPGDWSSYLRLIADTLKSKQSQKGKAELQTISEG